MSFSGLKLLVTAIHVELCPSHSQLTLDLLHNACSHWIKRHALLRSRIFRHYTADKRSILTNRPRYFVELSQQSLAQFTNVELIHTSDADQWQQVMRRHLHAGLDLFNSALWRLSVVLTNESANKAVFVFLMHHAITDGRNNAIFIELLSIIGALMETESVENKGIVDVEEIKSSLGRDDYVSLFVRAHPQVANEPSRHVFNRPTRIPASIGNDRASSSNTYGPGFDFWLAKFQPETLRNLLSRLKTKTNGAAKLTSLMQAAFCFVYKQLLVARGESELAQEPLSFIVVASGRDKFKIGDLQMGLYAMLLPTVLTSDEMRALTTVDSVWSMATEHTRLLHQRLGRHEEVAASIKKATTPSSDDNDDDHKSASLSIERLVQGTAVPTMDFLMTLSSTGRLPQTTSPLIRATEVYCILAKKDYDGYIFIRATSVQDTLCVSVCYNERMFSAAFIGEMKLSFVQLIETLSHS